MRSAPDGRLRSILASGYNSRERASSSPVNSRTSPCSDARRGPRWEWTPKPSGGRPPPRPARSSATRPRGTPRPSPGRAVLERPLGVESLANRAGGWGRGPDRVSKRGRARATGPWGGAALAPDPVDARSSSSPTWPPVTPRSSPMSSPVAQVRLPATHRGRSNGSCTTWGSGGFRDCRSAPHLRPCSPTPCSLPAPRRTAGSGRRAHPLGGRRYGLRRRSASRRRGYDAFRRASSERGSRREPAQDRRPGRSGGGPPQRSRSRVAGFARVPRCDNPPDVKTLYRASRVHTFTYPQRGSGC